MPCCKSHWIAYGIRTAPRPRVRAWTLDARITCITCNCVRRELASFTRRRFICFNSNSFIVFIAQLIIYYELYNYQEPPMSKITLCVAIVCGSELTHIQIVLELCVRLRMNSEQSDHNTHARAWHSKANYKFKSNYALFTVQHYLHTNLTVTSALWFYSSNCCWQNMLPVMCIVALHMMQQ